MMYRWVIATLAAGILILGWQSWSGANRVTQQQRQLEEVTRNQMLMANSAIFDANWALQQVQDPAAPESAAFIRQAAEGLIIARERLDVLREDAFAAIIPFEDVISLSERVHVVADGLKHGLQSGERERFYGQRNFLRVMTEHLPFPNQRRHLTAFSQGIAHIRAIAGQEGFILSDVPSAPPAMQLLVSGLHSPVRRGGYCWRELGNTRCVDMAGPADLVVETTPSPVLPSSQAELRFAWPPVLGSVTLKRLTGGQEPVPTPLSPDLTFALPKESGTYVYSVEARWESGNGTYAFKVNVK